MNIRKKGTASQKETAASSRPSQTGKDLKKGITTGDVLRIFSGAKIVKRSVEQQFELINKNKH